MNVRKPPPENRRLRGLNAELQKALLMARSYIDACAPADSQQRALVLHEIDAALANTGNSGYPQDLERLYEHARNSERAMGRLSREKYDTERALRKIAAAIARALKALKEAKDT